MDADLDSPYALAPGVLQHYGANTTARARSVLAIIYMDEDMRLSTPTNDMQRTDCNTWCPGAVPGEIIRTLCAAHPAV